MSRARNVRERWITEVLRTDAINDGCKLVLIAMSRHMSEAGHVSWPREKLAADVGLQTVQRVTNRIKEAREAGLLDLVRRGGNGVTAIYEAMLPHSQGARGEHPEGARGEHPQGTGSGHPVSGTLLTLPKAGQGARGEHPQRARVTYEPRPEGRAPDDSRGPGPHHAPNSSSNGKGAGTPVPRLAASPSVRTTAPQTGRSA